MKAPYFKFFVRDWLCSRSVLSMSGNGVKAYIYLLSESWLQTPRATLPALDAELASMARLDINSWNNIKQEVLSRFKIGTCDEHNGRLYNETLLEISRNYEKNQRPKNKNAKGSRKKREISRDERETNAACEYEHDSDSISFSDSYSETKREERYITPPSKDKVVAYISANKDREIDRNYHENEFSERKPPDNPPKRGESKVKESKLKINILVSFFRYCFARKTGRICRTGDMEAREIISRLVSLPSMENNNPYYYIISYLATTDEWMIEHFHFGLKNLCSMPDRVIWNPSTTSEMDKIIEDFNAEKGK